jgi:hypothetical protein
VTETYVCSHCRARDRRSYRVQFFLQTCPECAEHGRFLHASLLDVLDGIPEDDRPEEWGELDLDERLLYAVKNGLLDYSETLVS